MGDPCRDFTPSQDEHSSDEPLVPIQHLSLASSASNSNDSSSNKVEEEEEPVLVKPRRSGRAHKEVQRFKAGSGKVASTTNNSAENSRPSSPKQQQQQQGGPVPASPKVRMGLKLKSCSILVRFTSVFQGHGTWIS